MSSNEHDHFSSQAKICPACDNSESSILFNSTQKDYSYEGFVYLQCNGCKSIFLSAPNQQVNCQEDATRFHQEHWREAGTFQFQPESTFDERIGKIRGVAEQQRKVFEELIPNTAYKVLDFGAGEAHLVTAFLEMGIDAYGIEPDSAALEEARRRLSDRNRNHLIVGSAETLYSKAILDDLKKSGIPANGFDIIIIRDVLEHMYDPKRFLTALADTLLKPTGFMWISVPSSQDKQIELLGNCAWSVMAPFHRTLFSYNGLEQMLSAASFKVVKSYPASGRWGWTRGLAWKAGFASEHAKLRLESPEFKKFDFLVDEMFNRLTEGASLVDLNLIAKRHS